MVSESNRNVVVVGAGIIGLTTAIRLREDGHKVYVLTKQTPLTFFCQENSPSKGLQSFPYSSPTSAGIWVPTNLEDEKLREWASKTFKRFKKEAEEGLGVELIEGYALHRDEEISDLPWFSKLTAVAIETPSSDKNIPATHKSAFRYKAPVLDVEQYLVRLEERARDMGVIFQCSKQDENWDLERVCKFAKSQFGEQVTIVNCCGLGAGKFSGEKMIPGRGLSVKVSRPLGANYFVLEDGTTSNEIQKEHESVYITCVPRGTNYVLGSSLILGSSCEEVDISEAERVIDKCAEILPNVGTAKVEKVTVGLRPFTQDLTIRTEKQFNADCAARGIEMVANYGHGGRGISLCWGCADEVAQMIAGFTHSDAIALDLPERSTLYANRGP